MMIKGYLLGAKYCFAKYQGPNSEDSLLGKITCQKIKIQCYEEK